MNKNEIVYVSDCLLADVIGGGELNDHELCIGLNKNNFNVKKIRSYNFTLEKVDTDKFYIISNFALLKKEVKDKIQEKCKYIIYEHDHKYLKSRNPAIYKNYKAPKSEIVNLNFYKNAKKVFCQSSFHESIIKKNVEISNIYNVSGNLWSTQSLEILSSLGSNNKKDRYSILDSQISHKNTNDAVFYCEKKNYNYDLISSQDYIEFIKKLSMNDKFIFLPKTPETLSRVVVEARMLNIKTITNKNVGASYEDWFHLKGKDMIAFMLNKKEEIINKVMEIVCE